MLAASTCPEENGGSFGGLFMSLSSRQRIGDQRRRVATSVCIAVVVRPFFGQSAAAIAGQQIPLKWMFGHT